MHIDSLHSSSACAELTGTKQSHPAPCGNRVALQIVGVDW